MAQPQPNLDWYAEHGEDLDRHETEERLEALDDVVAEAGAERAQYLLRKLLARGYERGVPLIAGAALTAKKARSSPRWPSDVAPRPRTS